MVGVGCGDGLLALHVWRDVHVGIDLIVSGLATARPHSVTPVRADAARIPVQDEAASVVVAGGTGARSRVTSVVASCAGSSARAAR